MAFSNFGINGNHFKAGKLSLADDVNNGETAVITSSAQGTVQVTTSQLTASYAYIEQLDVNTINSVTTTETTLEVSDAKIIAGLSASSGVNGLQIGGSSTDTELASVLYDGSNLDLNLAGTTYAALSTSKFEVQGVVSGSGQLQGASVAVDGAVTATSASLGTVMGSAAQLSGDLRLEGALTMDNVTISNAGAIAGATTIDASGDLTVGTITNAEFTVDADGNTDIDGTLNVEGAATLQSTLSAQSASFTTIYGTGNAQFDADLVVSKSVNMGRSSAGNYAIKVLEEDVFGTVYNDLELGYGTEYDIKIGDNNFISGEAASVSVRGNLTASAGAKIEPWESGGDALQIAGNVLLDQSYVLKFGGNAHAAGHAGIKSEQSSNRLVLSSSLETFVSGALTTVSTVSGAAMQGTEGTLTSLNLQNGGITNAGAVAGATSIDGTGDLTMGSITMAEFTVDASGNTDIDGTLNVEGIATLQNNLVAQSASFTTVYGSGAAQFASTLLVEGAATIEGAVSGAAGTFDALAGTSLALQSGGITAAGAIAGATSIDGSGDLTMGSITMTDFAVDGSGNTDALSLDVGGGYGDGDGGATISSAGVLSIDGQFNHAANIIPAANGSQNIGSAAYRYNAVYANNVYTGDFHMKNERGDWTLFEESDHIRIRNNKTGQTFKLGMSLIEE